MRSAHKSAGPAPHHVHLNPLRLIEILLQQEKHWLNAIPRPRAILLLALTQGLASLNLAALGTVAPALESHLHIGNVAYGLLSTASILTGAAAALPVGILGDRQQRVPLLTKLILLWALAMLLSGISPGYDWFLITQMLAGAAGVSVGPVIASLSGDLFPPSWRGRAFGLIVGGELLGAGIGMILAGTINTLSNWRMVFVALAAMAILLAVLLWKGMREPERDNMNKLAAQLTQESAEHAPETTVSGKQPKRYLIEDIRKKSIQPVRKRILAEDPTQWHWLRAARTILSIPSNVILITASSAGYFYFTGLLAFGILYLTQRFHINTMAASTLFVGAGLGGIGGVVASGWIADFLLRRGLITARVWVTGIAFLLTIPFFLLALHTNRQVLEFIWLFMGSAALGATNPTLDAARLDIMHSRLWGRAEGIRISLRYILEAAAPFAFGWVSTHFSESYCHLQHCGDGYGLRISFEIFTVLLLVATLLMLTAIFTYPRDVATALFSQQVQKPRKP
ncbi:MFS transporter [Acidithiobacillus montserratensis]|uniref:MFS transporter n=1 Tax=Acidithiobacillus montserratensis TaxID=2729135 RepID=A0ACD5HEN5_9PROT|nr:MFS transporter [Acidithiobacillus montserratensis]MBN2679392.1 MFS transporter [Acidithiobacillaceae bacterium]MBU2746640.1 MFS transporter [Acidithiobacillus montserratensis]